MNSNECLAHPSQAFRRLAMAISLLAGIVASAGAQHVTKLSVNLNHILSNDKLTCTATINAAYGNSVALELSTTPAGLVTIPSTLTVPSGSTTASFDFTVPAVTTNKDFYIYAKVKGNQTYHYDKWTIWAPALDPPELRPDAVVGSTSTQALVKLNEVASAGGFEITMSSESKDWIGPSSAVVPAGSSSLTIMIPTPQVLSTATVAIKFSSVNGSYTKHLTLTPITATKLHLAPATAYRTATQGSTSTGTVTIACPAPPGGFTVDLFSTEKGVTVPASVLVPAGATQVSFTINIAPGKTSFSCGIEARPSQPLVAATLKVKAV